MATNSLGAMQFIEFHRADDRSAPPLLVAEHGEIIQRPGVDGTGVIRKGIKGQTFRMRSGVDAASGAAADALAQSYRTMQNAGLYALVWSGRDYFTLYDHKYVVIQVEPRVVTRLGASSGGLNPPSLAYVEATWTLIPILIAT